MPLTLSKTRIIKKLSPGEAGTKRLSQRFGTDLVCVRYRQDQEANRRYTTVELVIDSGPLQHLPPEPLNLLVRIAYNEPELRQAASRLGAIWDPKQRAWRMSKKTVQELQLERRIVIPK